MRTLNAVLAATARELERVGFEGLTVDGITASAGLAHGTFYRYFRSRSDAAVAVLRLYAAAVRHLRPRGGRLAAFDAIHRMNEFYVASYSANAALLAAREQIVQQRPDRAIARDRLNHRWSILVLRDLSVRRGMVSSALGTAFDHSLVRSAIAMADELLRERYVHQSTTLATLLPNDEETALLLSFAWYRLLYGCDPQATPEKVKLRLLARDAS